MASADPYRDYVKHPRYGRSPRITGINESEGNWRYSRESLVPNTGVRADKLRQNTMEPVRYYFDVDKTCVDCNRRFIFFADEQKHWFEELRFPVSSDCVRCIDCRKTDQSKRFLKKQYDELAGVPAERRTWEQNIQLADMCLSLIETGAFSIRSRQRVREFLNLVPNKQRYRLRFKQAVQRMQSLDSNIAPNI